MLEKHARMWNLHRSAVRYAVRAGSETIAELARGGIGVWWIEINGLRIGTAATGDDAFTELKRLIGAR